MGPTLSAADSAVNYFCAVSGSCYLTTPAERQRRAAALFDMLRTGKLHVNISTTFPLAEDADAHRYLESRQSTGKVLLIP